MDLRWLAAGIERDSRYFAMVRRATIIPCLLKISVIWLSDKGFFAFSSLTICLIKARIAVAEQAPPDSVDTWLPKKYLSSYTPRGVSIYFRVVTRETVDSCKPSSSAISRKTSGRIATSPCSKKLRCRSTMACDTRKIVEKRCWIFLIIHLASCIWLIRYWLELSRLRFKIPAYS